MAKVDYDAFAGIHRMAEAEATVDQRAAIILTYHAALEREIDVVLGGIMPYPERIRHLGYGHKIDVLAAVWKGDKQAGDKLYNVLFRFNELRNAVAHGDRIDLVEAALTRLLDAYRSIVPDADVHIEISEMAHGICSFMADGPPPKELMDTMAALDQLVNVTMPRVLGTRRDDDGRP